MSLVRNTWENVVGQSYDHQALLRENPDIMRRHEKLDRYFMALGLIAGLCSLAWHGLHHRPEDNQGVSKHHSVAQDISPPHPATTPAPRG